VGTYENISGKQNLTYRKNEVRQWETNELQVVIATDSTLKDASAINSICHQQGISFIRAETRGVFGTVFCDFGDDFEVHDVDGEIPWDGVYPRRWCIPRPGLIHTCICCSLTTSTHLNYLQFFTKLIPGWKTLLLESIETSLLRGRVKTCSRPSTPTNATPGLSDKLDHQGIALCSST
jgi:hypothetical protein